MPASRMHCHNLPPAAACASQILLAQRQLGKGIPIELRDRKQIDQHLFQTGQGIKKLHLQPRRRDAQRHGHLSYQQRSQPSRKEMTVAIGKQKKSNCRHSHDRGKNKSSVQLSVFRCRSSAFLVASPQNPPGQQQKQHYRQHIEQRLRPGSDKIGKMIKQLCFRIVKTHIVSRRSNQHNHPQYRAKTAGQHPRLQLFLLVKIEGGANTDKSRGS